MGCLVTASLDGTARLWDAATGLRLSDPLRHRAGVLSAAFNADGRRVITASLDKTAAIWNVPMADDIPPWLPELAESVGGLRLNSDRVPEPVPWADYAALKARLTNLQATDAFNDLVQQCFAP